MKECKSCNNSFSWRRWRYNCEMCGVVTCHNCIKHNTIFIPKLEYNNSLICNSCYSNIYKKQCPKCNKSYCIKCKLKWHKNKSCNNINQMNKLQKLKYNQNIKNNKKSKRFIKKQGFKECPQCTQVIEKISGCNHMQHKRSEGCTDPYGKDGITHFCYCCGEILKDSRHELDGTIHFKYGSSQPCRKV